MKFLPRAGVVGMKQTNTQEELGRSPEGEE